MTPLLSIDLRPRSTGELDRRAPAKAVIKNESPKSVLQVALHWTEPCSDGVCNDYKLEPGSTETVSVWGWLGRDGVLNEVLTIKAIADDASEEIWHGQPGLCQQALPRGFQREGGEAATVAVCKLTVTVRAVAEGEVVAQLKVTDSAMTINALKEQVSESWMKADAAPKAEEQNLLLKDDTLKDDALICTYGLHAFEDVELTLIRIPGLYIHVKDSYDRPYWGSWGFTFTTRPIEPDEESAVRQEAKDTRTSAKEFMKLLQDLPTWYGHMDIKRALLESKQDGKWSALEELVASEKDGFPFMEMKKSSEYGMNFDIKALCSGHLIYVSGSSSDYGRD
eukprot:TRINITY_DN81079_c0_g1_i1.p1 TRINITY_DN81079_c0_g1~~TRINITY_DN81079_c0_g1_i1.p1  ORF type:complete len:337 (+),score=51.85 TRINITY_DN81079_c0_g1_i1:74-1084(+)